MLESAVNHFGLDEIIETNGIQSLINKLKLIQMNPDKRQLKAIKHFAAELAKLDTNDHKYCEVNGVHYNYKKRLWVSQVRLDGKILQIKTSLDKKTVVDAHLNYLKSTA
jgi:hypothetical protein